jgi:molecular chaperone GrpE
VAEKHRVNSQQVHAENKNDLANSEIADGTSNATTCANSQSVSSDDNGQLDDLEKKLEEKQREVDSGRDAMLRALADLDNYKKRAQKERAEIRAATIAELMETLLPVLDNFEFGLAACAPSDNNGVIEGFKMIFTNFQNLLASYGLEAVYPLNEKFDVNFHDCVRRVLDEDRENDTVVSVDRKGYKLGGRLLRPAIVAVSHHADQKEGDREGHD